MPRRSARRGAPALALAALLCGAASGAEAREHRPAPAGAVRWLAPLDGAVLTAGGPVELAFEVASGWSGAAGLHEWEVFLSLDGGRTWSVRLTPHLELRATRARVRLPELISDDARLLLRLGDERIEYEQPVPAALAIRSRTVPGLDAALGASARPSLVRGESGRARGRGVALWASDERTGGSFRWVWYAGAASLGAGRRWSPGAVLPHWAAPERAPRVDAAAPRAGVGPTPLAAAASPRPAGRAASIPAPISPLDASGRRNE